MGHGCMKCAVDTWSRKNKDKKENRKKKHISMDTDKFIERAKQVHGNKYDYSKVNYINGRTKVCIVCPIHGEFWQMPYDHTTQKHECPKCANIKRRKCFASTKEKFIEKANNVFHGIYDYSKVEYINNSTKVLIICPKHGTFLCTPANHLKGRGCPVCKAERSVYENRLFNCLLKHFSNEEIIRQYRCDWLTNNKSLDFYFPKFKLAIEHQGSQHVIPVDFLGGVEKFKRTQILDKEKYDECMKNGVTLLYFSYEKCINFSSFFEEIETDEIKIIEKINKIKNNI